MATWKKINDRCGSRLCLTLYFSETWLCLNTATCVIPLNPLSSPVRYTFSTPFFTRPEAKLQAQDLRPLASDRLRLQIFWLAVHIWKERGSDNIPYSRVRRSLSSQTSGNVSTTYTFILFLKNKFIGKTVL